MIKFGVIGLGFGEFHVKTLANLPDAELVCVSDSNTAKSELIGQKYNVRSYDDGITMLQKEKIDAVIIAVNPQFRNSIFEYLQDKDIAIFCEKPWASNIEQAQKFATLCEKNTHRLMLGFSFRFHPAIIYAKKILNTHIGKPWLIHGEYIFDWLPPEESWLWKEEGGNGFFNENSCHLLDALRFLIGEPQSLYAEGIIKNGRKSAEAAIVNVTFENGAIANLALGGIGINNCNNFPQIKVIGEKGGLNLEGSDHMWKSCHWTLRNSEIQNTFEDSPERLDNTRYTHALTHFVTCIKNNVPPTASVQEGIASVKFAMAINKSITSQEKIYLQ